MWVIKIGGHLADDPVLPEWLEQIADLGGGRVVLVPGGGDFARHALCMRDTWRIDTMTLHNIAVLGMGQFAFVLQGLRPEFALCAREDDILDTLHAGRVAIWMPLGQLRHRAEPLHNPPLSADGLALWLAERLNAEELVLVKASPLPPVTDWDLLADEGLVEAQFAAAARGADLPITLLERDHCHTLYEMLIGTACRARLRPGLAD